MQRHSQRNELNSPPYSPASGWEKDLTLCKMLTVYFFRFHSRRQYAQRSVVIFTQATNIYSHYAVHAYAEPPLEHNFKQSVIALWAKHFEVSMSDVGSIAWIINRSSSAERCLESF